MVIGLAAIAHKLETNQSAQIMPLMYAILGNYGRYVRTYVIYNGFAVLIKLWQRILTVKAELNYSHKIM